MGEKTRPISQATIIGQGAPTTWAELSRDCCSVFGGGHESDDMRNAFRHGMRTVFNLLEAEMPSLAEVRAIPALVEAVEAALPIVECEEARHDILLKCTEMMGATEEQRRLREKHIRGKRREAYRARKAIEAALAAVKKGEE